MKQIKRTGIILNFIALLCFMSSKAQDDYTKSLNGVTKVHIETGTYVKIIAGTTNELKLTKYVYDNDDHDHDNCDHEHHVECDDCEHNNKDDRSKGLKAVYSGGVDNTGFGMMIEQEGAVLRIKDLKSNFQRRGLQIVLPKTMDIHLDCGNLGSAIIKGFSSEIEVNTNIGRIVLKDVTGPITAHTSTGTIDVDFSSVSQSSPITLSSSTGIVDVSLPSNTKADLELHSTMGTIYTDFELQKPSKDGMKVVGATRKIEAKLNNGGVKIVLRSSTGNVYLRKQ
ncbi:DUF4097 domain-containing protein [Psychroserpens sp. SPM9]|uniref:DUF4097 family beta strand repeat-containing protein n=1 Tax=Psychroserpens sp. SPM9 TaxID=2975598 RepID=UPI0021A7F201|nr:DUF4097 domain-containing protein [Psychroserpens sp. SPM9]MDG5490247.1 DUF4097 domain-containing protein [Psychroserpens sp. SPM9]